MILLHRKEAVIVHQVEKMDQVFLVNIAQRVMRVQIVKELDIVEEDRIRRGRTSLILLYIVIVKQDGIVI